MHLRNLFTSISVLGNAPIGFSLIKGLLHFGVKPANIFINKQHFAAPQLDVNTLDNNLDLIKASNLLCFAPTAEEQEELYQCPEKHGLIKKNYPLIFSFSRHPMSTFDFRIGVVQIGTSPLIESGFGTTALYANAHVTPYATLQTQTFFSCLGKIQWNNTQQDFDATSALIENTYDDAGKYLEQIKVKAKACGVPEAEAMSFASHTFFGVAKNAHQMLSAQAKVQPHKTDDEMPRFLPNTLRKS